jgi:uncharacterized protein YjlB
MSVRRPAPETYLFEDDGSIPNNPALPLLIYRNGISLAGTPDAEARIGEVLKDNGWVGIWRNGIYPYVHYHSQIHEALVIARGRAKVRFGGAGGEELDVAPGDVIVLPAGTGHQCLWESPDLSVIGAYPTSGKYDLCRGSKFEREQALRSIPEVPLPDTDPVTGGAGPLIELWRDKTS